MLIRIRDRVLYLQRERGAALVKTPFFVSAAFKAYKHSGVSVAFIWSGLYHRLFPLAHQPDRP